MVCHPPTDRKAPVPPCRLRPPGRRPRNRPGTRSGTRPPVPTRALTAALATAAAALALPCWPGGGTLAAQEPAVVPVPGLDDPAVRAVRSYREDHAASILRDYADFLEIPNVASDTANVRRSADHAVSMLRAVGVEAESWRLDGANPVVYGELDVDPSAPTLGLYVHYDGQPVDPDRWTHGPWTPVLYTRSMEAGGERIPFPEAGEAVDPDWRLYARSVADDKAPVAALVTVLRALEEAEIRPTANLRFLLDGEEEAGSPHLADYASAHREALEAVDLWLFLDGPIHQSGRPQLVFGVRGVTGLDVTVYGAARPLHSGHYGNWAPVPGQLLADLLASMKDGDTGEVLVEGFYDDVAPLGPEERAALEALPAYDAELKRELGLARTEGEPQELARRITLPSLTVRGLSSGNVGERARNVIPSRARAALGIRLVKGTDPERMKDRVEAHVRDRGFHIVRREPDLATRRAHPKLVRVVRQGGYPAARTPMDDPMARRAVEAARRAAGDELLLVPTLGGSLPLHLFTGELGAPTLVTPVANHDDNQHAPDENLRLGNFWYALDLYAALLTM